MSMQPASRILNPGGFTVAEIIFTVHGINMGRVGRDLSLFVSGSIVGQYIRTPRNLHRKFKRLGKPSLEEVFLCTKKWRKTKGQDRRNRTLYEGFRQCYDFLQKYKAFEDLVE